jgi:putrescine transport system substrate-binding protein
MIAALAGLAALPAAAQDGELHVYNWADYIGEDTVAQFEAETGIEVVYDVYDSNEVLEAKLLAGNSGYDVVVPTSTFLRRQVAAGVYRPLDRALLPNWENLDPKLMAAAEADDPGNEHSVIYLWGTNGIGYNVAAVEERLGEDAPVDSWALVFDPEHAAKLADCGITMLDTASEMVPLALNYLGLPPGSTEAADLEAAEALLMGVRPYVRYFNAMQYNTDLANGEVCVSVGFSGDILIAADNAEAAGQGIEIAYSVPNEGGMLWFDMLAIPADAPNPEAAHAFIDFLLRPEIIAQVTNLVFYPNANANADELVDPEILNDPTIYPSPEVMDRLFPQPVHDARDDRELTRLWTRVRSGQ